MNVSAKTEYACIAVLQLAISYGEQRPVRIREIAQAHGIPSRFLVQILLQLKGAGLVGSTRGASGGYQLIRDPAEITLGQVMRVIDGRAYEVASSAAVSTPSSRVLLAAWQQVADVQREMLDSVTFAELAERVRGQTDNMYYI